MLEQNYRSTQKILDAAHHIIIKNIHRKDKKLWTEKNGGHPITVYEAKNEKGESKFIIETIDELVKQEGLKFKNFVVLYRTNAQSRTIEESLLEYGFPYKVIGSVKFYDRKEVKDLIAYLKLIQNPNDLVSLERIINTPPRGIGKTAYSKLKKSDFNLNSLPSAKSFQSLIYDFKKSSQEKSLSKLLQVVIEKIKYDKYLLDNTKEGESRLENIKELFTVTKKYDPIPAPKGLSAFLEEASLMSNHDEVETKKDLINLMTLHCAKGLEFPVVFIIGCEEGIFPHSRSFLNPDEMEEERRLCYVGITRAKEKLFMTYANQRQLYGATLVNPPSRFIFDIPRDLKEHIFGDENIIDYDDL